MRLNKEGLNPGHQATKPPERLYHFLSPFQILKKNGTQHINLISGEVLPLLFALNDFWPPRRLPHTGAEVAAAQRAAIGSAREARSLPSTGLATTHRGGGEGPSRMPAGASVGPGGLGGVPAAAGNSRGSVWVESKLVVVTLGWGQASF